MCYVDECALWVVYHVAVNNSLHHITVAQIESVQRLIEYQQVWVLYERTGEQDHALLSAREFQEVAAFKVGYTEYVHPDAACLSFLVGNFFIQTDGIVKARCHYVDDL